MEIEQSRWRKVVVFGGKKLEGHRNKPIGLTHDENVDKFRQCVRDVDSFIRRGQLDKARVRLAEAIKLEPTNPYLRAFEDRIRSLEKAADPLVEDNTVDNKVPVRQKRGQVAEDVPTQRPPSEEDVRREVEREFQEKYTLEVQQAERQAAQVRLEFEESRKRSLQHLEQQLERAYQTHIIEERKRIESEAQAAIEVEKRKLQQKIEAHVLEQNRALKEMREEIRRDMEHTFLKRLEHISREYDEKFEMLGVSLPKTKEGKIDLYRLKMREFYRDGQPSVGNAQRLMRLKEILELTFDEHFTVESDVRLELYVDEVQKGILAGEITVRSKKTIEALRQKYAITKEQEDSIASFMQTSLKKGKSKGRLLVVDDDEALIRILELELKEHGYQVLTAVDVESGLDQLQHNAVDLILCDIKFPQGELDGFKLFSSVQQFPHLRRIPFIFMSALQDGVIIRSGVQLGVDDYLTKPLDIDLLLAIIDGKLKRFRTLVGG